MRLAHVFTLLALVSSANSCGGMLFYVICYFIGSDTDDVHA